MGFTATGFASKGTKTIVNITAFKVLLVAIATRARSKAELKEVTGLTNTTISRWMAVLSTGKDRLVYVESWKRGRAGNPTAMWRMGHDMPDAPRPKPLTSGQYSKRWRLEQLKKAATTTTKTETGLIHVSRTVSSIPRTAVK